MPRLFRIARYAQSCNHHGGCATASPGPTIPGPEEVPRISIDGPYFVESRDGHGFSCSTWAGSKLWLDSEDFGAAVSGTLEIAQARVVTNPSLAKYVLSFGGSGATVDYEIRERGSDVVIWRSSKSWPNQVSGCSLCCNDHARSHFVGWLEDLRRGTGRDRQNSSTSGKPCCFHSVHQNAVPKPIGEVM